MGSREQLKYAQERIVHAYSAKKAKVLKETTEEPEKLSPQDFIAAIKSGKIKLLPAVTEDGGSIMEIGYTRLTEVFDLSPYRRKAKVDQKARDKRMKSLDDEYTKIMDELMLGDMEKALALVQEFAKKEF